MKSGEIVSWLMIYGLLRSCEGGPCNRRPQGASGDRSPVDENFHILIEGNPSSYVPGQQYNLSLSSGNNFKFISFTMVAESENLGIIAGIDDSMGHFEIIDVAETRFSVSCENMIESTNTNTKSRIDVAWMAPINPNSGCMYIKVAVLQHRNVWFIDDGFLTKRICPEEIDEINSQTPPVDPCCACDEAKYEVVLERKWTRNTHSKDFPSEAWRTRFSEIIGASHSVDYRFWGYWSAASKGLQELAEHGSTKTLEEEIKSNSVNGTIRTIIKAPGIHYKMNVLGTTLAHVRVDPQHHLVSLTSKIEPSPDWILGVAGLELCLSNCTWINQKTLNLYPWDVGTDAGPSYMSPDQPQFPADVVRRITSTYPSDYRSPFYDESGAPLKPLATLYITRKKLYERDCDLVENLPLECATHPWNAWSDCNARCGAGTQQRFRFYKDVQLANSFKCQVRLEENQPCVGTQCGVNDEEGNLNRAPAAECDLGDWSDWSVCSSRCGNGYSTRSRNFVYPYAKDRCLSAVAVQLQQTKQCLGESCGGSIKTNRDEQVYSGYEEEPRLMEENQYVGHNQRPIYNRNTEMTLENSAENMQNSNVQRPLESFAENEEIASNTNSQRYPGSRNEFQPQIPPKFPASNSYGSEKFVGPQNRNNANRNTYEGMQPTQFPNHRNSYEGNQPTQFPNNRNRYEDLQPNQFPNNRNSYDMHQTPNNQRHRFAAANNQDSYSNAEYQPVMQEHCFINPEPSQEPCYKKKIIIQNYWFYDAEARLCKLFTANNCDESKNKFRTLDACEGTCLNPHLLSQPAEETGSIGMDEPQSQIKYSYGVPWPISGKFSQPQHLGIGNRHQVPQPSGLNAPDQQSTMQNQRGHSNRW